MKHLKKLAGVLLALAMVFTLALPAFADVGEGSNTITISEDGTKHVYQVYQLLKGTYDEESGELQNIDWGSSVSEEGNAAEAFADVTAETTVSVNTTAKTVTIGTATYTLTDEYATITYVEGTGYKLKGVEDGYYVIIDVANQEGGLGDDAYSAGIVKVVKDVTVTPKSATPTIDKQVHDETTDAEPNAVDGWGETADHAIYEVYQYKLIATLPDDADLDDYEHYYLQFVDTISEGVSFLGNVQVSVTNPKENTTVSFTLSDSVASASQTNPVNGEVTFTVTIQDLMQYVATLKGTVVTVTYDAYLNPKCKVGNDDSNQNKVSLKYSNNPAWNGEGTPETGETGPDYVFTFTYKVENTKIDGTTEKELAGAKFKLYTDYDAEMKTGSGEISLIYDATLVAYRPVKTGETAAEYMESDENGKFNIVGLDAGTYYLVETEAPTGYNNLDAPITIVIEATHAENSKTTASVTFTNEQNVSNKVENFNGSTLPETGGMGTTLFYVLGGGLVLVAVVLLVTKKRMKE